MSEWKGRGKGKGRESPKCACDNAEAGLCISEEGLSPQAGDSTMGEEMSKGYFMYEPSVRQRQKNVHDKKSDGPLGKTRKIAWRCSPVPGEGEYAFLRENRNHARRPETVTFLWIYRLGVIPKGGRRMSIIKLSNTL